jgi:preprotein translocase subunit SecF
MSNNIQDIKDTLKSHIEWEDKKYDSIKKEFAAKWVERGFYAVILILIGIAFEVMLRGN